MTTIKPLVGLDEHPEPLDVVAARAEVAFWRPADYPGLELRRARYRCHTFARHLHESWSLGLVLEGRTCFELSGQSWQAVAGDLVLISPGVVHDCNPAGDTPLGYWMFYLDPVLWPLESADGQLQPVWQEATYFASMCQFACRLSGEGALADEEPPADDAPQMLASLLRDMLANWPRQTYQKPCAMSVSAQPAETWLAQVAQQLANELTRTVPLAELSVVCGISASHLNRRFAACYGLPPHRYQLQCRLDAAKRLLLGGLPISCVAHELGFSDQSHFTRWFRRCVGATPARYQQGH